MATGPAHDLGLTEKRTGTAASSDGCCGGDASGGCGGGGCGGMCESESSNASASGGCGSPGGCACSAPAPTVRADSVIGAPRVSGSRAKVSTVLHVTGMTRARCIVTVMNALERIRGVDSVEVDLQSGGISPVTVISSQILDTDAVGTALSDAGYALATEPVPVG